MAPSSPMRGRSALVARRINPGFAPGVGGTLADSARLRCAVGSVVPILRGADVRHAPLVTVPSVEAVHLERPESRGHVSEEDEPVRIANVHAPAAIVDVADV